MKLRDYIKDKFVYIIIWLLMIITVVFFLKMFRIVNIAIVVVIISIILFSSIIIGYDYYLKEQFYQDYTNKLKQLDKKCLISELITEPRFIEGKILSRSLYEINKSMYEEIEIHQQNVQDFKEYIELWIHEVKLPIASAKLMIHNHETNPRKLKEQINRIENYVEQVLYYSRLENSKNDYLIKECNLGDIIRNVVRRNQDSLLYHEIRIEINNVNVAILSDSKWLEFIINQVVSNCIKYQGKEKCTITFNVVEESDIALEIIDNGIGINEADIKSVFDKSFTGRNGRLVSSSTGMGLYITKSLCDKLGHKIKIESIVEKFTKVTIYFKDDQYYKVVR